MYSQVEIETARDLFCIEKEILLMELREMLEKTRHLERLLLQTAPARAPIHEQVSDSDTFKPSSDVECPPKKRIKLE
jgi:hypothetical protein